MKYFQDGHVLSVKLAGPDTIKAKILGQKKYGVGLKMKNDELTGECTCISFENEGFCKHCVAAGLAFVNDGEFETISKSYARKLISRINKASRETKYNPGEEIDIREEEGHQPQDEIMTTESGYRYRIIDRGVVLWVKNPVDELLNGFDLLGIKEGFRIDGYYFYDGMGGNFRPVAFPSDMKLPGWHDADKNPFFNPDSLPSELDVDIDSYIVHNETPKSIFQKSLFLRELYDIGAFWHGCSDWHVKGIMLEKEEVIKTLSSEVSLYRHVKKLPEHFLPRISFSVNKKTAGVSFYFFSGGLGSTIGLFQLSDTHLSDGRVKTNKRRCIIDLGPGPIP